MSKEPEAKWHNNLQEIIIGLIAKIADGNALGHPVWTGKVIEFIKDTCRTILRSRKVHWYHINSPNAFTGKYTLEMMSTNVGIVPK